MPVEIKVSIRKSDELKAPATVGTLDSHERPVQWPAKRYRDDTGIWMIHVFLFIYIFQTRNSSRKRDLNIYENLRDIFLKT